MCIYVRHMYVLKSCNIITCVPGSAVKFPSSLVKRLRRINVETRLKGYKYFEIERDFFNKLGVLIDGDYKFGVLLLVFVRFLGGDTGNLYRNGFL